MLGKINALTPTQFENLTYDSVRAAGLKNLVWRTPGADGGRDIEGFAYSVDLSGHELIQKWYVECKHYKTSIDWSTIYKKIAHADVHGADVLLLVTNSNPSPACETEISAWNSARRWPAVRVWKGYDLDFILRSYPEVAAAYGLIEDKERLRASVLPLCSIISRVVQAAYVRNEFGQGHELELEVGAGLSELLSNVIRNIDEYGRLVAGQKLENLPQYDWLSWQGSVGQWEEITVRALFPFVRFMLGAEAIYFASSGSVGELKVINPTHPYAGEAVVQIGTVAHWSKVEILQQPNGCFHLTSR